LICKLKTASTPGSGFQISQHTSKPVACFHLIGAEAMKFGGWQRLTAEYAMQFGVETPKWPPQVAQKS
jgi:hypothetical protein